MKQLLRDRPAAAVALAFALLVLSIGLAAYSFLQLKAATDARYVSGQRLQALTLALSALQDAETGQRGFLLTGLDGHLEPYRLAVARIEPTLDTLALRFDGDADAHAAVTEIHRLTRAKLAELERTIALRRRDGLERAREMVASHLDENLMENLRARIGALQAREQAALDRRVRAAQARASTGMAALLLSSALCVPAVGSAAWLVARERRARRRVVELEGEARTQTARLDEERRRAQDAFISALNEIAYRHDVIEDRLEWRGAVRAVLGVDPATLGSSPDRWLERIHPDDRALVDGEFERMRATREHFDLEYRFQHADGSWHYMLDRGVPHFDDGGNLVEVIGILRDVSTRRSAETQIALLYSRVQDILASVRDGFVALDRDWTFIYANDPAAALLGVASQPLEGANMWVLFAPALGTPFEVVARRVMHGGAPEQMDNYYPPTGRWYRNHFYPTREGLAILFEDVTAQKTMQAELELERERYRTTIEQAPIGVLEVDFDGFIRSANRAMARMVGHDPRELIGMNIRDITDAGFVEADERAWAAMRRGELSHRQVDKRYRRKDGGVFWGELTASLMRNADGTPLHFISVVQDISARRKAAALLAQSNERARAFARELSTAVERERTRIAREIHDELGQAFTGLKMDVGWLRRRLDGQPGPTAAMALQRLEAMGHFIDETLDSARRIATELRPALLDSLGLAAAIEAQVRQSALRSGLTAQLDLDAQVHPAPDQATTLFRIAQEALTNIARHASATLVRVRLAGEAHEALLEVEDDGKGFDARDRRTNRLGLLGIRERAQLAGGSADIDSRAGGGTCVRVRVPLAAPPAPQLDEAA